MLDRVMDVARQDGVAGVGRKVRKKLEDVVLRRYYRLAGLDPVPSRYGVSMAANWGDFTFESCIFGFYGNYLADYLKRQTRPFAFLDIGANQGLYSLIAGKNDACSRAIAFEPVKETFSLLSRNVHLNGLSEKVRTLNFGISTEDARVRIYLKDGHSGAASLHANGGAGVAEEIEIRQAAAIGQYLPEDLPVIVKIDVEGHEKAVISSLASSPFVDRIVAVFYEVDESWVEPPELERLLMDIGIRDFEKVGTGSHYDVMASKRIS